MSKTLENIFGMVSDDAVNEIPKRISNETLSNDNLNLSTSETDPIDSIINDLKARRTAQDTDNGAWKNTGDLAQILQQKYKKRGILISYDIKGCFQLKRVVCKVVEDLKQLGFKDDIWFDKDEGDTTSNASFTQRLESAEECNAAILFVSHQYFNRAPSKYEAEIFTQRKDDDEITSSGNPFRLFIVKYSQSAETLPAEFHDTDVDLTSRRLCHASFAEKATAVVGGLCEKLEGYVTFSTKLHHEFNGDRRDTSGRRGFKDKPVYTWGVQDVQDWLGCLRVHERYRVSFEENEIDGYLLGSLEDCDMLEDLNVDNKLVRQKIFHSLNSVLDRETSWDKCCKQRKRRDNNIYLVFDPMDTWIAEFIKSDLERAGIMAQMNKGSEISTTSARLLAEAVIVVFLFTSSSENSHIVFKEILLAAWLKKQIMTAVFDHCSMKTARCALRAIIAKQPAINFGRERYLDGLDVLRYHVTRRQGVLPRVILQQHYVKKMRDSLQPLECLLHRTEGFEASRFKRPKVFLSYHWDTQNKVGKIKEYLDRNGCETITDSMRPIAVSLARPRNCKEYSILSNQTPVLVQDGISNAAVVILCVTLKYLHCDNFIKDTQLAELHQKAVVPVLLQWCPRTPEKITAVAMRLDMASTLIDMSNEQLFRRNLPRLLELIMKKRVK